MIVIGLIGGAGAGKDSLADHLAHTYGTHKLGFADALKLLAADLFGWDYDRLGDLDYKETVSDHEPLSVTPDLVTRVLNNQRVAVTASNVDHLQKILATCTRDLTRRRILQILGTEGFRAINPGHWVNMGIRRAVDLLPEPAVFADVRFLNEAAAIRALPAGYLWRLLRTDTASAATGDDAKAHASETELDRIVPHVTLRAAFGELPLLFAWGDRLAESIGLQPVGDAQ